MEKYIQLMNDWICGNTTITYVNGIKHNQNINFLDYSENIIRFYNKKGDNFNMLFEMEESNLETIDFLIANIILCEYEELYDMSNRLNEDQMNCLSLWKTDNGFDFKLILRSEEKEDYELLKKE